MIINPEHQKANELLNTIDEELNKQDKLKKEEEIKDHIKKADEYIKKEDYKNAKEELEAALVLDQENADAKRLLEEVNKKIKEKEDNDKVSSHLEKARSLMNKGKYEEAKKEAQEVLTIDENNQEAKNIIKEADDKIKEQANAEELKKANGTYVGTIEGITTEAVVMGQTITTKAVIIVKNGTVESFTVDTVALQKGVDKNTFVHDGKTIKVTPVVKNGIPKLEILVDSEEVSYSVNKVAE